MKKVLRMLGHALVIVVLTLAVDFTLLATMFSGMKRSWADAATVYTEAYISTPFFREPAETALRKYFIAGDVHFTELGHRLLFDEVRRVESLPSPEVQSSRNPRTESVQ
jgi:hypothetical protein